MKSVRSCVYDYYRICFWRDREIVQALMQFYYNRDIYMGQLCVKKNSNVDASIPVLYCNTYDISENEDNGNLTINTDLFLLCLMYTAAL